MVRGRFSPVNLHIASRSDAGLSVIPRVSDRTTGNKPLPPLLMKISMGIAKTHPQCSCSLQRESARSREAFVALGSNRPPQASILTCACEPNLSSL